MSMPPEMAAAADRPLTTAFRLVYLLEDSDPQATFLTQQLGHFGYEVERFATIEGLRNALAHYTPRIVLTDVNLAEGPKAGLSMIPEIKARDRDPPYVLAMSTATDFATRLEAVRVGVDGYYVKPCNISKLVDQMDHLIEARPDEPLRVLVVDDQASAAKLYAAILRQAGMRTETLIDPTRVLEVLAEFRPDCILSDMQMGVCTGFEMASVIRQEDAFAGMPVIFMTGDTISARHSLESLKHGGDEFLSKTMDREDLVAIVRARATRARTMEAHLLRDGMTGLYKHSATKDMLVREVSRARRRGDQLSVAMVDIDHFKSVNDTHGHAVGDTVIVTLARLLAQNLRMGDIVGRYGGEEFLVALADTSGEQAVRVMDYLRQRFGDVDHTAEGVYFKTSFSCGIASLSDRHADAPTLTEAADRALYKAKRNGRDQVVLAE